MAIDKYYFDSFLTASPAALEILMIVHRFLSNFARQGKAPLTALKRLQQEHPNECIRLSVKTKGCSGFMYDISLCKVPDKADEQVEVCDGLKLMLDTRSFFVILGSELDYVEDRLNSKFVFNNPNAKSMCGCGESFNI